MKKKAENKKKEQKGRNRERHPNSATLGPSITSYKPQKSHGEPILLTSPSYRRAHRADKNIYLPKMRTGVDEGKGIQKPDEQIQKVDPQLLIETEKKIKY